MALLYRLISGEDDAAFCYRMSGLIARGWKPLGSPSYAYDGKNQVMKVAQAITMEIEGEFTEDVKLEEL